MGWIHWDQVDSWRSFCWRRHLACDVRPSDQWRRYRLCLDYARAIGFIQVRFAPTNSTALDRVAYMSIYLSWLLTSIILLSAEWWQQGLRSPETTCHATTQWRLVRSPLFLHCNTENPDHDGWSVAPLSRHTYNLLLYVTLQPIARSLAIYSISGLSCSRCGDFLWSFSMGTLSDKLGHTNRLFITVVASAVVAFSWQAVSTVSGIFVWAVCYAWFSGASISLQSLAILPVVPDPKLRFMGSCIAILCQVSSFGSISGSPIAGALLRHHHHDAFKASNSYRPEDFHSLL